MPMFVQAGLWGLLAASGLLIGAAIAVAAHPKLSHRVIAAVMGFGGGVLLAVLSVDLMEKAFADGGPTAAIAGFLLGATVFSTANWLLAQHGAKHRNRCGGCVRQPSEAQHAGSGMAIAVGALLDGIPESLVIGLSLVGGEKIGWGLIAGFFLANIPQGLSSAAGMKQAERSSVYVFAVWTGIPLLSGLAAAIGYLALGSAAPAVGGAILAFAAGGVLAMLAETMIPEAFEDAQPFIGVITVVGFLVAFLLIKTQV
ncbi:MAG: ZIP family zinc transporter [Proteobacteria bacterium]|nr:ZIP family zinc transporter [Burkholderiales bacterium]